MKRVVEDNKKFLTAVDTVYKTFNSDIINDIKAELKANPLYVAVCRTNPEKVAHYKTSDDSYAVGDDESRRIVTTLQRFIRRRLKFTEDRIASAELDEFCKAVMIEATKDPKKSVNLKLLTGLDMLKAFYIGFGAGTCMTGKYRQPIVDFFALNEDKISLLIYNKNGIQARALLWKLDDGQLYIDRIYRNNNAADKVFYDWAKINNALTRNSNDTHGDAPKHIMVTIKFSHYIPYMDTLRFAHIMSYNNSKSIGVAKLSNLQDNNFRVKMQSQFGNTDNLFANCYGCGVPMMNLKLEQKLYCDKCSRNATKICEGCYKQISKLVPHSCDTISYRQDFIGTDDEHITIILNNI